MRGGYSPAKGLQNTNPLWVVVPIGKKISSTTTSPIPVADVTARQLLVVSTRALVWSKYHADTKLFRSIRHYYRK